ncbi:hypothetical protein HOY82DRAFT_600186 [Tuber indicum]|nr:hypothetical protein HOY82DRAFT_600186 [Tuber indicum]
MAARGGPILSTTLNFALRQFPPHFVHPSTQKFYFNHEGPRCNVIRADDFRADSGRTDSVRTSEGKTASERHLQLPAGISPIPHLKPPAGPGSSSRAVVWDAKMYVRPGHPPMHPRPSRPDWTVGNTVRVTLG